MLVATAIARMRIVLDEDAAGKWVDNTHLYPLLDDGQNFAIQVALGKEVALLETDYKSPILTPLITLDASNTTTIGAGFQEYNLPSDFLATNYAEYSYTNGGIRYPCAILDFNKAVKRGSNTFTNSFNTPIVYVRAEKLGFFPQPIGAGASNYAHYYYKQPTAVASGSEFTLREETHEDILNIAISFALAKDTDPRADVFFQKGLMELNKKC